MIGNIIIIGIAVSILLYAKRVFWSELAKKPICFWSAVGLIIFFMCSIILPNIEFIKSPFTPEASIKVIDSITNKPVSGASIIIDWGYESSSFPYHYYGVSTSQQIKITDTNGMITVGSKIKCLAIDLLIIYRRNTGGVGVIVLNKGYKHIHKEINNKEDNIIYLDKPTTITDIDTEISNLLAIKEMAKRRYEHDVSAYIEQIADAVSRSLTIPGA